MSNTESHERLLAIVQKGAEQYVQTHTARFGPFDFSEQSLQKVELQLGDLADFIEEIEESAFIYYSQLAAAYILWVAYRSVGGIFYNLVHDKFAPQPILVVGQPEFEISIATLEKVQGRLKNGEADNIIFFYEGFIQRVKNAKEGEKVFYF